MARSDTDWVRDGWACHQIGEKHARMAVFSSEATDLKAALNLAIDRRSPVARRLAAVATEVRVRSGPNRATMLGGDCRGSSRKVSHTY